MIKTDVKLPFNYTLDDIYSALEVRLPLTREEIKEHQIIKRSLNLSDKQAIHYDVTVGISLSPEREAGLLKMRKKVSAVEDMTIDIPPCHFATRPVVVGAGPAGLFCALLLAEAGARPILYERGSRIEERVKKVDSFIRFGILDSECNIQFGEGGAGSFSDGKLKVGGMDKYKYKVLSAFVDAGAPEDILYTVGAHVGTDKLRGIITNIRHRIISLGGEVFFDSRLSDIYVRDGRVRGGRVEREDGIIDFECDSLILATGHSARDSFKLLRDIGVPMQAKGFGIGIRIEHPREYIDSLVYGDNPPGGIGAASYHLVTHLKDCRSVYSFCMCPGGVVVPAASEESGIVTNGMSEYARSADNSNAAFLVSVTPDDFGSDDPLAGIDFQRAIERRAYNLTGNSYKAPVSRLDAFMRGEKTIAFGSVNPSYAIGTEIASAEDYLPEFAISSLRQAVRDFDSWMGGFYYPDAVMTGPETRTTSPVRVERNSDFEVTGISGLYPIGEGAGYAGGIVSSARDGLMAAETLIFKHKK